MKKKAKQRTRKGGRTYANVVKINKDGDWVDVTLRCHGMHPRRLLRDKPASVYLAWGRFEHEWVNLSNQT